MLKSSLFCPASLCHCLRRSCHDYVVTLGKVSPTLSVPEHIPKPAYTRKKWYFLSQRDECPSKPEIKNAQEIQGMREACRLTAEVLAFAKNLVRPGVTTDEIDQRVHEKIISRNAYPSPLLYKGFISFPTIV